MKKVELHVHLEGTISPELAIRLARRNHVTIPQSLMDSNCSHYLYQDFNDFLTVFDVVAALIKTPEDYYDLTLDYLMQCAKEETIYVEMMYSPEHAEKVTGIASINHLNAIQQAIDDAEKQFGIIGRILITAVRHFGADSVMRVAKEAVNQSVAGVVGFALGGDEINYPPELFKKAYSLVAAEGLMCTAHAGEFADANSIVTAVKALHLKRVGHGVRAIESPAVIDFLLKNNIALELCPSSNIRLGIYKTMQEHPLPLFLEAGVPISINSDDPPFMMTTIGQEYQRVQHAYQYDLDTMNRITEMAINSAFVDEKSKAALKQQLKKKADDSAFKI